MADLPLRGADGQILADGIHVIDGQKVKVVNHTHGNPDVPATPATGPLVGAGGTILADGHHTIDGQGVDIRNQWGNTNPATGTPATPTHNVGGIETQKTSPDPTKRIP